MSWQFVENAIRSIDKQMKEADWVPDLIIGIANGGSIPATLLSKLTGIPCKTYVVQLRDGEIQELIDADYLRFLLGKDPIKVLLVDDINDSGKTLEWIIGNWDWETEDTSIMFKIATIHNNVASPIKVDFAYEEIDKEADPSLWIVYPWETFVDYTIYP